MKFSMKLLFALSAFAIAACDSDNNNNNQGGNTPQGPFGKLQVVHASPDAPLVNLLVDGQPSGQNIPFGAATIEGNFEVGTYSVQVDAVLPGGATATVIGPADVAISADTITTIVALGPVAVPLDFAAIEKPDTDPAAGNARLFVLHATSGAGGLPVDVYVTAPDADLTATAPTGTFSFKETLGPVEVPAGDYQVRVTLAGDPAALAYDSGTVALGAGDDLTVAAVPNVKGGPAAVQLLALGPGGAGEVLDVRTPTGLRVGHLSPDTVPVDVLVNGGVFLNDVPFPAITGITALTPDTYTVSITDGSNPGSIFLPDTELTLEAGTVYTVLATDFFANLTVDILAEDDPRPVALYSKVRIIHASPTAQNVDIYLLDPALQFDLTGQTPTLTDVPFGANTGYLALDAAAYDVVVTPTGTTTAAISASLPALEAGGVYTAIARDPEPGSQEFGLEVLVDVLDEAT